MDLQMYLQQNIDVASLFHIYFIYLRQLTPATIFKMVKH
jgi:hypothetical protein